ncbi:MAG: DUF1003 domain-containing protein [Chthoniobacterales bacterium]
MIQHDTGICAISQRTLPMDELVPLSAIRPGVASLIVSAHPELSEESLISNDELNKYRSDYISQALKDDMGEITALEEDVVRSLREHEILNENINDSFDEQFTFGEKLADKIASFGGSWTFILAFGGFLAIWIIINTLILSRRPPDPYPFILLNLLLSALASLQAPVIMMSQNRQEAKDRIRAEHDYKINLKAELEIRHLHEKVDHLLKQQSQRLLEIQQIQIDLLREALHKPEIPK